MPHTNFVTSFNEGGWGWGGSKWNNQHHVWQVDLGRTITQTQANTSKPLKRKWEATTENYKYCVEKSPALSYTRIMFFSHGYCLLTSATTVITWLLPHLWYNNYYMTTKALKNVHWLYKMSLLAHFCKIMNQKKKKKELLHW